MNHVAVMVAKTARKCAVVQPLLLYTQLTLSVLLGSGLLA